MNKHCPRGRARLLTFLTLTALLMCGTLPAQRIAALFQHSDAEVVRAATTGWEAFLAEKSRQNAAGYRLTDLESFRDGANDRQYIGLFTKSPLRDSVGRASSWKDFIKLKRKMAAAEYTMIDVSSVIRDEYDVDFYAVWVKSENPTIHKVWYLDGRKTMIKKTKDMARDRFRIKKIHVVALPHAEPAFVVLYHFSPINRYNFLYFADTPEEFEKERRQRIDSKVQLIDYAYFREGDRDQYLGIFQDGLYESEFLPDLDYDELDGRSQELDRAAGLRLFNLSVN